MHFKRHHLRKNEVKQLAEELRRGFGMDPKELMGRAIELIELGNRRELLLVDGVPLFLKMGERFFPTLRSLGRIRLGRVVIDMGAVPHVANGAHVMAPGVVRADEDISPGDAVMVVDERHGKPIAIGLALVAGPVMRAPEGRVVENLHHVGDVVWKLSKKVRSSVVDG